MTVGWKKICTTYLDYDLGSEILVIINIPDGVKLSEPIKSQVLMMIGKEVQK